MNSKTFDQAEIFFTKNKSKLLEIMHSEFDGRIDYQCEYDQVAVWFEGFSICYQNGDMNGNGKGEPYYNNDGANCGICKLKNILKEDQRFQPLIAIDEFSKNEYLLDFIYEYCEEYAEKHKIASYFEG